MGLELMFVVVAVIFAVSVVLLIKAKGRDYNRVVYALFALIVIYLGYVHDQDEDMADALAMDLSVAIAEKDIDSDLIDEVTGYLEKRVGTRDITVSHLVKVERLLERYKGMEAPEPKSEFLGVLPSGNGDYTEIGDADLIEAREASEMFFGNAVIELLEARLNAICAYRVTDDNQIVISDQVRCQKEKIRQLQLISDKKTAVFMDYRGRIQAK